MSYTEKGHASSCGVHFRADGRCTCAVGEVERLRANLENMRSGVDAIGAHQKQALTERDDARRQAEVLRDEVRAQAERERQHVEEIERLRAEVSRRSRQIPGYHGLRELVAGRTTTFSLRDVGTLLDERDGAWAEVERLRLVIRDARRAALEEAAARAEAVAGQWNGIDDYKRGGRCAAMNAARSIRALAAKDAP